MKFHLGNWVEKLKPRAKTAYSAVSTYASRQKVWVINLFEWTTARFKSEAKEFTSLNLTPLKPTQGISEHAFYVDHLVDGIKNKDITNIALTGSYGAGKSSILSDLDDIKEIKVLEISFSSLGANVQGYISDSDAEKHQKLTDLTNLIQKEILKQILFKEEKKKLTSSKFHRISQPNIWLHFTISLVIASALFVYLVASGVGANILKGFQIFDMALVVAESAIAYIVFVSSILLMMLTLGSKLKIEKIGNSSVSLSLTGENSYFDQYLDEILYFFEATDYDVVVFEDIDRFDNLYIFENLRQLNTIINNSKQISRQITFIYAVKDSIFSKNVLDKSKINIKENNDKTLVGIDDSKAEQISNRTKFFDLIIPVVPFITSSNSKDHMLEVFDEEFRDELKVPIGIVAKYITDMRLVKNIYNEFLVFKEKLFTEDSGLSLAKLFAMVVYKNINLEDFERIKEGKSKIDKVMTEFAMFVDDEMSKISAQITEKTQRLNTLDTIEGRSKTFGAILNVYVTRLLSQIQGTFLKAALNGEAVKVEDFSTAEFWQQILSNTESTSLIVSYNSQQTGYQQSLTLSIEDIRKIVRDNLSPDEWAASDAKHLRDEIDSLTRKRESLYYIDLKTAISENNDLFIKLAGGALQGDDITWDLVVGGYIEEGFVNYTSIYQEFSISMKARGYLLTNLRHNKPSYLHKFEGDGDIEAMLSEASSVELRSRGMYNVEILDYLLKKSDSRIQPIIDSLARGDQEDINFIGVYLEKGKKYQDFLKLLAATWENIFVFLGDHHSLLDHEQAQLIDIALRGVDSKKSYAASEYIKLLISQRPEYFKLLSKSKDKAVVENALEVLLSMNVYFESFDNLSDVAKEFVKEMAIYDINTENMEYVFGEPTPSLDKINLQTSNGYSLVTSMLGQYIALFTGDHQSDYMLSGESGFETVINDTFKRNPEYIDVILAHADPLRCVIDDITVFNVKIWDMLVDAVLISNTVSNILAYFNHYVVQPDKPDAISNQLAEYIKTVQDVVMDKNYSEYDEARLKNFTVALINSEKVDISTKIRVAEVSYPEEYIPVESLHKKEGEFFGLLLENNIIEDSQESYEYIRDLNIETKSLYISKSEKFIEYVGEFELTTDEINLISKNEEIPKAVKSYLLSNIEHYEESTSLSSNLNLAEYAANESIELTYEQLKVLVDGAEDGHMVKLINLAVDKLTDENILNLLTAMGGTYAQLTKPRVRPVFDNSAENLALITDMQRRGYVSSFSANGSIKVSMKSSI